MSSNNSIFNLSVTGHRPKKISNKLYDVNSDLSKTYISYFKSYIKSLLEVHDTINCITGMALGVDTLFAIAVLQLQNSAYPVYLTCAIPCLNHSSKWPSSSTKIYDAILLRADDTVLVTNQAYTRDCMQLRNEYMVDHADSVLAVWDGTPGGTANCVNYTKSVGKPVDIVSPSSIQS